MTRHRFVGAALVLTFVVVAASPARAVPLGGSISELADLAGSIIGPTDDAVAELDVFGPVPVDIPTPPNAEITGFSFWGYPYELGGYFSASVTFTTDAAPDDIVTLYATTLTASGYPQTRDTVSDADSFVSRTLTFGYPASDYEFADLAVSVREIDAVDVEVTIEFSDTATPDLFPSYGGWTEGLPLPLGRLYRTSVYVFDLGEPVMALGVEYEYPGATPIDMERQLESSLPSGGYSNDADDNGGEREGGTDLASNVIDYGTVEYWDATFDDAPGARVEVSVTVDLTP